FYPRIPGLIAVGLDASGSPFPQLLVEQPLQRDGELWLDAGRIELETKANIRDALGKSDELEPMRKQCSDVVQKLL
uniref:Glycerol acyltransferase n=1 Tax=Bursaphelenchus xylophilus TaxID=6326 RepID=A0A1I7SJA6_BURXY